MRRSITLVMALLAAFAALPLGPATAAAPQNGRIAFARDVPHQIFSMASDGTDLTRLTLSKMPNYNPTWSPDGTEIAFVRNQLNMESATKLIVMAADGSAHAALFKQAYPLLDPDWFPDATHIIVCLPGGRAGFRLFVVPTDGSTPTQVGPDGACEAVVSPDGSKIAFVQYKWDHGPKYDVWVMNIDGTGLTQITTDGRSTEPAWSPDGTQIVFVRKVKSPSDPWRQTDLFRMNADGTNRVRLTETRRWEDAPTWSPDGTLILFDRPTYWDQFASTDLWTMTPDGSNLVQLMDTPGVYERWPDWQAVT
jgi:TolB protein